MGDVCPSTEVSDPAITTPVDEASGSTEPDASSLNNTGTAGDELDTTPATEVNEGQITDLGTPVNAAPPDPIVEPAAEQPLVTPAGETEPTTGEPITDFAGRADHRLGFDGIDLVKVLQPVIRWRYGSLAPSEDEVAGLAGLRLRVEARLADSLGKTAYLFRRVLAYLRIGSRNTLFLS